MSKVRPHISTTEMTPLKNSTDLDMGRRPELKSVDFFEGIISVVEIFTILCLKPLKKCYTVWEHDPSPATWPWKCNEPPHLAVEMRYGHGRSVLSAYVNVGGSGRAATAVMNVNRISRPLARLRILLCLTANFTPHISQPGQQISVKFQ